MKKIVYLLSIIFILMPLAACSGTSDSPTSLSKEGISPYDLSKREHYVLESFGMEDSSQLLSFHAPKEATGIQINVYRLDASNNWEVIGGGTVWKETNKNTEPLIGTIAMQLKENQVIECTITTDGRASFKTPEIISNAGEMASSIGFLREFQKIECNKEIPVALMVYDLGTKMPDFSLPDYFEPSKFEGMDRVEAVTIKYTTETLADDIS